jgi:hypothetical protein
MKTIVIAGGTGLMGDAIVRLWPEKANFKILTRNKLSSSKENVSYIPWTPEEPGDWFTALENTDILINLCGRSVDCRYNEKNKKEIFDSRILPTQTLNYVVALLQHPPKVWINASTATIYRDSENKQLDEIQGELGTGFSVEIAKAWEKAFFEKEITGVRKVAARSSMVLSNKGGVIPVFKKLVKYGAGGKQGDGNQFISWIHEQDLVQALYFISTKNEISGICNITAPEPITNKNFMKLFREKSHSWLAIPSGKLMLEIGAWMIGTETELILKSRNVVPKRLLDHGFVFRYPNCQSALQDLLKK